MELSMRLMPLMVAIVTLAGGCAQPTLTYSNFLQDTSKLQVSADRPDSALWRKPNAPLTQYRKVMIDEPVIYASVNAGAPLNADLKDRLAGEMRAALEEKLGASYLVVREPGPDTLRVRAAITEVQSTPMTGNSPADVRVPILFTESHMEAEVMDSLTVDPLLMLVDSRRGKDISAVQGQIRWESVRALTREWAESLRKTLTAGQ
jgi:hypothetical protein